MRRISLALGVVWVVEIKTTESLLENTSLRSVGLEISVNFNVRKSAYYAHNNKRYWRSEQSLRFDEMTFLFMFVLAMVLCL